MDTEPPVTNEELKQLMVAQHAEVMARLTEVVAQTAELTQHTVECTWKNNEQPFKCAYHPKNPWPSDLCPDHAARIGKPHRDIHLART